MIIATILPIFFLYFVLVSGYCAELLNCGLQKYMDRNIFFRHLLLFLSIYIFTFVLNWYTFASLQIQPLSSDKKDKEEPTETTIDFMTNANNLIKWLGYSIFIYVIFLISTKSELKYIFIFFGYIVLALIAQIIMKSFSTEEYHESNSKLFISKEDYSDKNSDLIIMLHNITTGGFIGTMTLLFYGFYKYYLRQRKDHRRNWSMIKFLFGVSSPGGKECENL